MTTFVGLVTRIPQFHILVETLKFIDAELPGSNLVATLNDSEQNLTVFAPTNAAFGQLAADLGFDGNVHDTSAVIGFLTTAVDPTTLRDVVTYHVAGGRLTSQDIADAGTVATLQGAEINATLGDDFKLNLIDKEPDLTDPTTIFTNVHLSNGILHVVDRVLLPIDLPGNGDPAPDAPTIVGIAAGDDNFSILVAALGFIDGELGSDLIGTLSNPDAELTVFAPTNAAFGQLAVDLGFDGDPADTGAVTAFLTTLGAQTLSDVVQYHVVSGTLTEADIVGGAQVTTITGDTIGTGNLPALEDKEPDLADPTLVATDVIASNGIVHVIDRVLLPIDLPGNTVAEPTIVEVASDNPDFSILLAAVAYIDANLAGSDLAGALSNPDAALTVFAPTNAAFGQLAVDLGYVGAPDDTDAVTAFLVENVDVATLDAVVKYHVAGSELTAADIAAAGSVETLGGTIGAGELPTLTDLEPDLIDPSLIATDIQTGNGIIHVIDRVLLPVDLAGNGAPTITDIVASSGEGFDDNSADFDILLEAVKTAGLADTLAGDVDFTVFAPNDDAFVKLAQDLGFNGDDEGDAWGYLVDALTVITKGDPIPLLTTVLTYHVTGQSLQASQVLGLESITTLQGGALGVSGTALVDLDPDTFDANLIATDIQASNGVVHVIDEVLIPADLLAGENTDLLIGTDGYNFFHAGAGDDFVSGKGGNDYLLLGSGNDVGLGGEGRDLISGWRGDDHVDGGAGNDRLYGGRGEDVVNGGSGNDRIFGGKDDDIITGGEGSDVLYGGSGADVFVFAAGDGRDQIRDFDAGHDQIDLSGYGLNSIDDLQITGNSYNSYIDLGDGEGIVLSHVNITSLTEDSFIF